MAFGTRSGNAERKSPMKDLIAREILKLKFTKEEEKKETERQAVMNIINQLDAEECELLEEIMGADVEEWTLENMQKKILHDEIQTTLYNRFVSALLSRYEWGREGIEDFLNEFILSVPKEFLKLSTRELLLQVKLILCCSKRAKVGFIENKMLTTGELITTAKTLKLFNGREDEKGSFRCFICKAEGHRKAECPRLEGEKKWKKENEAKGVKKICSTFDDRSSYQVVIEPKPIKLEVNDHVLSTEGVLDTKADVTVIPWHIWEELDKPVLEELPVQLTGPGGAKLKAEGFIKLTVRGPVGSVENLRCVVMREEELLLDPGTFIQLFGTLENACRKVATPIKTNFNSIKSYLETYPEIYDESIPKDKKIEVDYVCRPRKMEASLREMTRQFVLNEVKNGNMVEVKFPKQACPVTAVPKKNGEIRLCIDGSFINSNFAHIPLELPPLLELQKKISEYPNKEKLVFSLIDCRCAYRLIKVSERTNEWTTMALEFGYFKSNCLVYGLSQSGVLFFNSLKRVLGNTEGVIAFMDDILILHDEDDEQPLIQVLEKLRKNNLKISEEKLILGEKVVEYTGYEISRHGIRATPEAIQKTLETPIPKNKTELLMLKGKISRLRNFIGEESSEFERKIMDKRDIWSTEKDKVWQLVKERLLERTILEYFEPEKEKLILETGWTLESVKFTLWSTPRSTETAKVLKKKLINVGSKGLTECEKNYTSIEKSALAVRLGLEKFHMYTKAYVTEVRTANASLVSVWNKKCNYLNPHFSRISIWKAECDMFCYNLKLEKKIDEVLEKMAEIKEIKKITISTPDIPIDIQAIEDEEYESLKRKIIEKLPFTSRYEKSMVSNINGLEVRDNVIFVFGRPLLPPKAYKDIAEWAHEGHFAVENMLHKIREIFMAPGIRKDVSEVYQKCHICQVVNKRKNYKMREWVPTTGENQRWHMDVASLENQLYLVAVDVNSNFIMAKKIATQDANQILFALREMFAENGTPQILVSDNYKSFMSTSVKNFCLKKGVRQVFTVPYESYSNGPAEQAVKSIKQGLAKSNKEGKGNSKEMLDTVLLNHHSSTYDSQGRTPLERRIGTSDNYKFGNSYVFARQYDEDPIYFKSAASSEWKPGKLLERLSEHTFIVEDEGTGHHLMVKEDQFKERLTTTAPTMKFNSVNTQCLITVGFDNEPSEEIPENLLRQVEQVFSKKWNKDQNYLWHRMVLLKELADQDPLAQEEEVEKFDESLAALTKEKLSEHKIICAVDGSNTPVGFSVIVTIKDGEKFTWLKGYSMGKKFNPLEKNLTHMDMETEAILVALTMTQNSEIPVICDSQSAMSTAKSLARSHNIERARHHKIHNIARKLQEDDFDRVMWGPRNFLKISKVADEHSHGNTEG
uniref:RNA-directed DNA polymerase n=2 Tax=Strongyloides papillosus TaxID=174720 RepID=A0A0N5B758_STREA